MTALYLYALAAADHPMRLDGMVGVGPERPPVQGVREGELQAAVSPVAGQLRPKRRDLMAHEQVIEELWRQGPVLPMRFGVVAPDMEGVRQWLGTEQQNSSARLRELGRRAEFHVRALQTEEEALREVLGADPRLAERRNAVTGMSREERLDYGTAVADVLTRLQQEDARTIDDALHPLADDLRPSAGGGTAFFACSYLVAPERVGAFRETADRLAESFAPRVVLRLSGPLAPYSFVAGAATAGAGSGPWA